MNFSENAEINSEINNYIRKICYDPYTGELCDIETMNLMDRIISAEEFAEDFLYDCDYTVIGGEENYEKFIHYVAYKIDRLIPRFFFMENHKDLSEKYTSLLTKRIFTTYGKDGFEETENFIYQYKQSFAAEEEYIKKTAATEAQIELLKKLSQAQGYQIINSEYLTKIQANTIIKYFNGETETEPLIFDFFTILI